MNELAELLIKNNISIGTVESFTVGNFATMLGNIPGISKVYKGSLVTYQSETKERLLGIEHPLIEKYGVVSKEIATLMCVNGKSILDVDLCISFTGNAGPDAMEGKPVGEVYIGIAYEDVVVYKLNLEGSRKEIALKAIDFAQKKRDSLKHAALEFKKIKEKMKNKAYIGIGGIIYGWKKRSRNKRC